jgi:3-methyl-2-oxobutanoate hydroxymethyltransferase
MIRSGAVMLLIEAVPAEVSKRIVELAVSPHTMEPVPVIGCGAGSACHGHVVVLHDLVGLTPWHPPFVTPTTNLGEQLENAAAQWAELIAGGEYLKNDHPYKMK